MFIFAYLLFPFIFPIFEHKECWFPTDPHQSSISFQLANQHTSERVRARVNKLTHEHSLSIIDHIPFHYSQKSTSPRTLRTKSLPRCFLVTLTSSNNQIVCAARARKSRSSKQKQMQTHLSSLLTGPLCPFRRLRIGGCTSRYLAEWGPGLPKWLTNNLGTRIDFVYA